MNTELLYSDSLIQISNESILFLNYYYPFGNKRVSFDTVDTIVIQKPTIRNGKYRYYGTGDFHTWFPPDDRSSRDKIFILRQKNKWWRVGFTVENSQVVLDFLRKMCTLIEE